MALSVLRGVGIEAVSAVLAPDRIDMEDELRYFGGSREAALKAAAISGVRSRRVAGDGVCASDLCLQAAERLFLADESFRQDVDMLLFVSQSPDYPLPATASLLQAALGLPPACAAMDMNSGCSGFTHGLFVLCSMVASGACRKALLLVGDTQARFLDRDNRVSAPLFGDAGSATLITRRQGENISFLAGNDGRGHEALMIPGGGSRIPPRAEEGPDAPYNAVIRDAQGNPWTLGGYGQLRMDGMRVFSFGIGEVPAHCKRHLELAACPPAAVDWLLLHQANKLMLQSIAKKLGVAAAKAPFSVLERYGNLGAASLPALICEQWGGSETKSGKGESPADPERGKRGCCLLCGFGAGFSWSSCLLSLEGARCLPLADYEDKGKGQSRDQGIAYWHDKFLHNR